MLLLGASILRTRQRHLYGVEENLRRCGSCGLVGRSGGGGGGGGRDGVFAVFEGHLVFVSSVLSRHWNRLVLTMPLKGFLGAPGSLRYLRTT